MNPLVMRGDDLIAILNVLPRNCVACKESRDARCDCCNMIFCSQCKVDFGNSVNMLLQQELVDLEQLICLVVSKPKGNSLNFAFHLIQKLSRLDSLGCHREVIIILPEIAFMLRRLEYCHNMIVHSRFQAGNLGQNHFDWEEESGTISFVNVPIHSIMADDLLCHDKIMVLNLLMVKLVFKQRCQSLQTLSKSWKGRVSGTMIDSIGEFLGAHSKWKNISPPLLEKQCMDLVKLLYQIDPHFVPALLRTCQSHRARSVLRSVSSTSIRSLRHWLVFCRLIHNDFVLKFIKEVAADIPQCNGTFRESSNL